MLPFNELQEIYNKDNLENDYVALILSLKEKGWSLEEIKKLPLTTFLKLPEWYNYLSNKQKAK